MMRPHQNCVTTIKPYFEGENGLSHQERDALFNKIIIKHGTWEVKKSY
jgi:hypothetical protein